MPKNTGRRPGWHPFQRQKRVGGRFYRRPDTADLVMALKQLRRTLAASPTDAERLAAARNLVNNWRHYDTNGCLADLHDILNGTTKKGTP